MKVTRTSPVTGASNTMDLDVTLDQLREYAETNCLIQDVFPGLTGPEREFLKTGCTPEDWETMFGGDEEEEDDDD